MLPEQSWNLKAVSALFLQIYPFTTFYLSGMESAWLVTNSCDLTPLDCSAQQNVAFCLSGLESSHQGESLKKIGLCEKTWDVLCIPQ